VQVQASEYNGSAAQVVVSVLPEHLSEELP